jgi:benzoate-CoA ligase
MWWGKGSKTVSDTASPPPADDIPRDYNFATDLFQRFQAQGWVDRVAYIDSRASMSFGELRVRAEKFSRLLESMHVRPEERVLVCLPDCLAWPIVFLGALRAGRVAVPLNTLLTPDEYRFMLADSRASVLVVGKDLHAKFADILPAFKGLRVIVASEEPEGHRWRLDDMLEKISAASPYQPPPTTRDDTAFWLYTSGSTGQPKAAVHAHADLRLTNSFYAAPIIGINEQDVIYSVAKLFFAYGLGNSLTFPLSAGATTVLVPERPTPEAAARVMRNHNVTTFFGVPTFYAAFLASAFAPPRKQVKLRRCISAGEALPADVGRRWTERYGVEILDGLGSTEMLHIFLSNRPGEVRYGTSGKPVPGYEVRLVDDEGGVITSSGTMGELQVRGPTSAIMYWNNREQSRATFVGEWTRSGDKYIRDEQGYYVYCGRRDDMLKVGGMYVSPFEVEGALQSHEDVLEAAVIGCPDDEKLIKPKAFVVLKSPHKACDELVQALQEHCRGKLAPYKYPRWIEFRTELPKTATGKIQRFKLRAELDAN